MQKVSNITISNYTYNTAQAGLPSPGSTSYARFQNDFESNGTLANRLETTQIIKCAKERACGLAFVRVCGLGRAHRVWKLLPKMCA